MDTPYVWRCSECGDDFEGSGPGHSAFMKHAQEDHGMKPAQCAGGVVDVHTDEVVLPGCGTQVLMKGRKLGFITENPNSRAIDVGSYDDPDDAPKGKEKPAKEKPLTPREKLELGRLDKQAKMTGVVVLSNVKLGSVPYFLFYEAQALWPNRYPDDSAESMTRFVEDCVVFFAMKAKMNTIHLDMSDFMREEEDDDDGGDTQAHTPIS